MQAFVSSLPELSPRGAKVNEVGAQGAGMRELLPPRPRRTCTFGLPSVPSCPQRPPLCPPVPPRAFARRCPPLVPHSPPLSLIPSPHCLPTHSNRQ